MAIDRDQNRKLIGFVADISGSRQRATWRDQPRSAADRRRRDAPMSWLCKRSGSKVRSLRLGASCSLQGASRERHWSTTSSTRGSNPELGVNHGQLRVTAHRPAPLPRSLFAQLNPTVGAAHTVIPKLRSADSIPVTRSTVEAQVGDLGLVCCPGQFRRPAPGPYHFPLIRLEGERSRRSGGHAARSSRLSWRVLAVRPRNGRRPAPCRIGSPRSRIESSTVCRPPRGCPSHRCWRRTRSSHR
ncbi:hypothetical protein YWIDRAFT_03485 [Streptomyces sp. SceaMP-e96]|nr:hypothetical protein YWIDRAFT_03485 [Streptomyces sp. SceaMP-e96]